MPGGSLDGVTDGEWTGGVVESDAGSGPPTVDRWRTVTAPGRSEAFADADGPVAYRTTVGDPRSGSDERAVVEVGDGRSPIAVWVNGARLGEHDSRVGSALFEFEPRAENELVVVRRPPETLGGIYETDAVPDALGVPDIRGDVSVEGRPRTFLRRFAVAPVPTDDGAAIDAEIEVDAGESVEGTVTLSVRPEGFRGGASMERANFEAGAGERVTVSKRLPIRDPKPWWPRGYGPQHRYAVRAKLGDETLEEPVGFRTIDREDDALVINGERVRANGFTRLPGADPAADVRRAVDANATILRARAHLPSPELYDACDEAGLLVWQDLPATGPDLPAERGSELATAIAGSYGNHPSLAIYGVQDDPADPYAEPLGDGRLSRLRFRWRAWRTNADRTDAETVADAFADAVDGNAVVVPVAGPPGTGPDAAHLYPGWRYLAAEDVEWLLETYPSLGSIVGGFGAGSLVREVDPGTVAGLDPTCFERVGIATGDGPEGSGDDESTGDDSSGSAVEASQRHQAAVLKTVAEALRRRGAAVLTASTLRDPSPDGGMGVVAADGAPKPAFEAIADAYEPLQAVLEGPPTPGTAGIVLLNDTPDRQEATVRWRAGDREGAEEAVVEPLDRADAGTVEIPSGADAVELAVVAGERTVTNRYDL